MASNFLSCAARTTLMSRFEEDELSQSSINLALCAIPFILRTLNSRNGTMQAQPKTMFKSSPQRQLTAERNDHYDEIV